METLVWLVILAVAGVALWYFWPKTDTNKDGKVDFNDAVANVKAEADVNKDGKVDVADAKVVAAKVETEVKKATAKAKKAADVNEDGKVNKADAKAAVKKVTSKVKAVK